MNLPDKPSELIRLALNDLALCAADPNYSIEMYEWHKPRDDGVCQVCLAGAVMAKSLNARPTAELYPHHFPDRQKIKALDDFHDGLVCRALDQLGQDLSKWGHGARNREITPYRTDSVAFTADMRQLADDLEAAGY